MGKQWRENADSLVGKRDAAAKAAVIGNKPGAVESAVAAKETALRDTATELGGYRHEAVAQLITENARLAELSPRTQRRLCRLKPLRLTD